MKSFAFISLVVFIQLFVAVHSRAIKNNEVSVVYKFDVELEKYKHKKQNRYEVEDLEEEIETPESNLIKRLALEDDEEFEAKLKELENAEDEDLVDEIPNEFPNEEERLLKRGTISSSEYFRSQLSSIEKKIYDTVNSINNRNTITSLRIEIPNLVNYKIKKSYIAKYTSRAIGALVRDHPEYWWIKKYSIRFSSNSQNYVTNLKITIVSDYSISSINTYKNKVKSKATSIANAAKKRSGTYKRLLYIHDYLVKYIKYKDGANYSYNVFGALIKNACACEGYAETFAYIARLINVPTICVTSDSHKWNYVYLKSNWYAVDVTFDDPTVNHVTYASGNAKNLSHKFFLVGRNSVIKKQKTYTTYSNRKLVTYLEFEGATGFKFPTLASSAYKA